MKSQYDVLKNILNDPKLNWIKVDYAGHAKAKIDSWFRSQTGETTNHIKRSHFFTSKLVSSCSTSLLLTMARDTGSKNEDGEFDFRSLMIADLDPETLKGRINISEIMVAENFDSYRSVRLAGLPVFPQPENDTKFALELMSLRNLETLKSKMSSKLSNLKNKLNKDEVFEQMGYKILWSKPEGFSDCILDENNNKVEKVSSPTVGFQLHPSMPSELKFNAKDYTLDNIVSLWREIETISSKIKVKVEALRPYELGVMERLTTDRNTPFSIGGIEFVVKAINSASYEYTEEDKAKIENKTYRIGKTPKIKGSWNLEMIVPSSVETSETVEQEAIFV